MTTKVRDLKPHQIASLAQHCLYKLQKHDERMNNNANIQAYQKMSKYLKAIEAFYQEEQRKIEEQDPFEQDFMSMLEEPKQAVSRPKKGSFNPFAQ